LYTIIDPAAATRQDLLFVVRPQVDDAGQLRRAVRTRHESRGTAVGPEVVEHENEAAVSALYRMEQAG
jgi:hypothetical protein